MAERHYCSPECPCRLNRIGIEDAGGFFGALWGVCCVVIFFWLLAVVIQDTPAQRQVWVDQQGKHPTGIVWTRPR